MRRIRGLQDHELGSTKALREVNRRMEKLGRAASKRSTAAQDRGRKLTDELKHHNEATAKQLRRSVGHTASRRLFDSSANAGNRSDPTYIATAQERAKSVREKFMPNLPSDTRAALETYDVVLIDSVIHNVLEARAQIAEQGLGLDDLAIHLVYQTAAVNTDLDPSKRLAMTAKAMVSAILLQQVGGQQRYPF